jgi:peptidoglycan/xylan/chitin deacetylase (PgdA/CDA1 family)
MRFALYTDCFLHYKTLVCKITNITPKCRGIGIIWLVLLFGLSAKSVEKAEDSKQVPPPLGATKVDAAVQDDGVRVAILGYHDFSKTSKETEMRINTDKFRRQMQALKDQGISVVRMEDFQAWKRGEKTLPPRSVVITIDDGWLSVFTDAFPVLREFGYPFTVFLYTKYIDVGGKSMTSEMVKEMQADGASIGNHSHTHPYPATVRRSKAKGAGNYREFLNQEMLQSKEILEKKFGQMITTYCYPGGYHTPEMFDFGREHAYQQMFTVLPGKIKRDSDDFTLPRYVILGTHDHIFTLATEFAGAATTSEMDGTLAKQTVPYPVMPEPGKKIKSRTPVISANLSTVEQLDPATLVMRVAGFGEVPATFDAEHKTLTWPVNRRLRTESCQVSITWKNQAGKSVESPLRWTFGVDRQAAYQPVEE